MAPTIGAKHCSANNLKYLCNPLPKIVNELHPNTCIYLTPLASHDHMTKLEGSIYLYARLIQLMTGYVVDTVVPPFNVVFGRKHFALKNRVKRGYRVKRGDTDLILNGYYKPSDTVLHCL